MNRRTLREQVAAINWCHPIDLGDGVITRPQWYVRRRFARRLQFLDLPQDLTGKTVLDVGAWDGFFSFECERRGAARVLAIDQYAWDHYGMDGFLLASSVRGSKVEHRRMAVEDLSPAAVGTFDLVLFLGVLYHVRSPIAALDRLRSVTKGTLICETHGLVPAVHESYPLISFFPGDTSATGGAREFSAIPTLECLQQMLVSSGFSQIKVKHRPSMRGVKKIKALLTNRPQSGRLIVHAS